METAQKQTQLGHSGVAKLGQNAKAARRSPKPLLFLEYSSCYDSFMMKRCSRCGDDFPEEVYAFKNPAKGWRQSACPDCMRLYRKEHYRRHPKPYKERAHERNATILKENHEKLFQYLSQHPCVDCGESDVVVLELDHVRGRKEASISSFLRRKCVWDRIRREIEKCEVRCANCHRRRTVKSLGWWRDDFRSEAEVAG